jgi:hypothetical protein
MLLLRTYLISLTERTFSMAVGMMTGFIEDKA